MEQRPIITSQHIRRVKIIALRNGRWFKLHPGERAIINLTIKILNYIRSELLIKILLKIFDKISPKISYIYKAYWIGVKMLEKKLETARKIGYRKIGRLKKDIKYIIYLGIWYLNTPIYYRPNIGV